MKYHLVDLHNDLLSYIGANPKKHTPHDIETRSSVEQYRLCGNSIVVYVAFTSHDAPQHHLELEKQASIFSRLHQLSPDSYARPEELEGSEKVVPFFAIEGASCFARDEEPLDAVFSRYEAVMEKYRISPVYISLTWNGVNRFGAGAFCSKEEEKIGLTPDGKALVDFLSDKITAFDVSHASDTLARDLRDYIEKKGYSTKYIASHSNFRTIHDSPRNLPDDIAKYISEKKGVIGLNCIRPFLGESENAFLDHVEYGLGLVGEDAISIGADFFSLESLPVNQKARFENYFYDSLSNVSALPHLFTTLTQRLGKNTAEKIAYQNALERVLLPHVEYNAEEEHR